MGGASRLGISGRTDRSAHRLQGENALSLVFPLGSTFPRPAFGGKDGWGERRFAALSWTKSFEEVSHRGDLRTLPPHAPACLDRPVNCGRYPPLPKEMAV